MLLAYLQPHTLANSHIRTTTRSCKFFQIVHNCAAGLVPVFKLLTQYQEL